MKKVFTLIELLIVVAIITILAAIWSPWMWMGGKPTTYPLDYDPT